MDDSDDDYVETKAAQKQDQGYSWEDQYHRSWDVVQEDGHGSLEGLVTSIVETNKRRRMPAAVQSVRRGIIRNVVLLLDLSFAMTDTDMRPTRQQLEITYAIEFVTEFFNQNPISQMAVVAMVDGLAKLVSPLGGNPHDHILALQTLRKTEPQGVPSLQNALAMAQAVLYQVPNHCTKEILLVFGALLSNDPGDINTTIQDLVRHKIRVKIIGLAAQVAVCNTIAKVTNFGDKTAYSVALNESHFKSLFSEVTTPLAENSINAKKTSTLIKMGFPKRHTDNTPSLCTCHAQLTKIGFTCPQCAAKVCTLPTVCPICNLTLILSTHLARSYHHLFPLENFHQIDSMDGDSCYSCMKLFKHEHKYRCPKCQKHFCIDCDLYCHDTLHNCPGCQSSPHVMS